MVFMYFVKKHRLLFLIIFALILRFVLLFPDFSFDVNNHMVWAKDAIRRGLSGFYETPSSQAFAVPYPNYPPLAIYFFYLSYPLQAIIHKFVWWLNTTISLFPSNLIFFTETNNFFAAMFYFIGPD